MAKRVISQVARDITKAWQDAPRNVSPLLQCLESVRVPQDRCGRDSAADIARMFLANATAWQGIAARTLRRELAELIGATREQRAQWEI